MPSFFLIGAAAFFVMTYILKSKNRDRTFFSFITGLLLLIFSIMGFFRFKNYILITLVIVVYYLANAIYDMKHRKLKATDTVASKNKVKNTKRKN